jgi:hypothetical protein
MAKGFNWKGIADHGDGTFTTKGKREKSRLLKSLHTSGFKVRSRKNTDGSWNVSTVGYMRPSRRQTVSRGIRPQVRAARMEGGGGRYRPIRGRYIPIRGRYVRYPSNMHRAPMGGYSGGYMGGPSFRPVRGSGKSMYQKLADWQKQRMKDRQERIKKESEWKKTEQEVNEKMKQDRIAKEREEATQQIKRNQEKDRLRQIAVQHEQEEQARMRSQQSQLTQQRHAEFRATRESQRSALPPAQKVDQGQLQEAREESVT